MNTVNTVKKQNLVKLKRKKKIIQRNRKIAIISILLVLLFIIGISIKNMYISYRCSNFLYSLDYYFTHWKNKDLRLIKVESFSVLSKEDNTITIEAYGFAYEKPYKRTYLIGKFVKNDNGSWHMKTVNVKEVNSSDDKSKIKI